MRRIHKRSALFGFAAMMMVLLVTTSKGSEPDANIQLRGGLQNARIRFELENEGHVAFIGGSITEMNGYRPMVMQLLKRRFPETRFTFTDAGVSSTCSTTGAFRLHEDVLSKGPVDLFFIEFAVNDDQDAVHARRECIRGMEGIVRHTRMHNPNADMVMTYFVNPPMLDAWQAGRVPLSVAAHDAVASHYNVSTVNLAKEVAERISGGKLTWEGFGGTHPKPYGNKICADMIDRLMTAAWKQPRLAGKPPPHAMPTRPLDEHSYFRGRLVDVASATNVDRMAIQIPNWSALKGACRPRFSKQKLLCADSSGAQSTLGFDGTAVGAYVLAGPDAGIVEASIDDGPYAPVNLYHRFSQGLHYPRTVMFASDLDAGRHTLRLRISAEKDPRSLGHVMRVLHFVAN